MKIGIVGAGAMGSMFAYFFTKAKMDVTLLENNANIIKHYKHEINIIPDHEIIKIKLNIVDTLQHLKDREIIFIFVKSYDTEEAIKKITPNISKQTIIVSLQNGLGNREIIARFIPEDKIVYGSTSIGATKVDNSTIRLGGMGSIVIGGKSKSVKIIEEILVKAGLDTTVTDNPNAAVWKKAIINAGINPIGALLEIPNGKIISNEFAKSIQEQIVREAVYTAISLGLEFDPDDMIEQTRIVCEKTAANLCSMLQDITAKRRTEIDSINGKITEYAKKNSIATPYNDVMYNLIKAKELFY
jgi:2-dehydropantoate 2-reductase